MLVEVWHVLYTTPEKAKQRVMDFLACVVHWWRKFGNAAIESEAVVGVYGRLWKACRC